MTWREVDMPDVAAQTEYAGRRVRRTDRSEFIMHGGMDTLVLEPPKYEVWDDEPAVMEPPC
jgi:hypothetical protein